MLKINKQPCDMTENEIAAVGVDLCYQIHVMYGPGLLESVYEAILVYELRKLGFFVHQQYPIPVIHEEVQFEVGFRADVIVQRKLIVELKSVEVLSSVFSKILLTYLRLTDIRLGLLVNFGEELIKNGIKRVVNNL